MDNWKTLIYQGISYKNYEINEIGIIRNCITKHELKQSIRSRANKKGNEYLVTYIGLGKRGTSKIVILHRAVAETFLSNENSYNYVLFKDNNFKNICVSNLYWYPHKGYSNENEYKKKRKKCTSDSVIKRRKKLKENAVIYKGGKCCICGYNKYFGALEFHHLNSFEKDFSISASGTTRSWERIKIELDKCICVCANCHREIHAGLINIENC